jgi:crossover junction endodeoxyribonuclease RuvC
MKIIGIDPGYDRLGIAILDKPRSGKEKVEYSSCFQTSSKDDIYSRFKKIGQEITRLLERYEPDALAIENLFLTKNQKTAMRVAEVRGIIIYEAVKRGLSVHEYSPMEIKTAVTGDGSSDKSRMIKMITLLVDLPARKAIDDEYDAIAVALTYAANSRA